MKDAGATLAPSPLALIRNMFLDPAQRTFAIGVWATSFSAGAEFGGALGIAILGSIGTAVYRSEVAHAFPDGAPPVPGLRRSFRP